jgi:hypothetical protein
MLVSILKHSSCFSLNDRIVAVMVHLVQALKRTIRLQHLFQHLDGLAARLTGLPPGLVHPLELGFLSLGLLGSLLVAHRIAARDYPVRTARAFVPWAGLFLLLTAAALWLLYQPMEMRGAMILGG